MANTLKAELKKYLESLDAGKDTKASLFRVSNHLNNPEITIPENQKGKEEIHAFLRLLFFDTPASTEIITNANMEKSLAFLEKIDRITDHPSPKKSK